MSGLMFLSKFGNFSAIISSNTFSAPFSLSSPGSHIMQILVCLIVSHFSKVLFFILFSLCSLNFITSIDLSSSLLTLSYASSNLLLSPTSEFFTSVEFFNPRISIWFFFFIISISLCFIVYLMRSHYHIFLTFLIMVYFSSLKITIMATLKSMSVLNGTSGHSHRQVLVPASPPPSARIILSSSSVCPVIFCWKLDILDNML